MTNLKTRLQRIEGQQPTAGLEAITRIVRVIVGKGGEPLMKEDGTPWEIVRELQACP